ncbi:MAG: MmgE/PrpD family protein [Hyphomicrobiaceae bacterium]|nr:MmgE/PrpD family protein [Hyphomicrobiaceae bacterium]
MSIAEHEPQRQPSDFALTRDAATWLAGLTTDKISPRARLWARHALLDWIGVTLAARDEPLVAILCEELAGESAPCTVIGQGKRANLLDAALINGSASHALDYDDVGRAVHGHPSVPVFPALLALAEVMDVSGRALLDAFVAGVEVESAIGDMTVDSHYAQGFHATGTLGAIGAAAAAAKLLGLDAEATARALSIAASQSAGLKCNFGTMVKPFHAGKAAANGLLAARLAARGFTASHNGLEGPQGFADVLSPRFVSGPIRPNAEAPFHVEKILFKFHASCYSTHATIEALKDLRSKHDVGLDDLDNIAIFVNTRQAGNCSIPDPETGLQVKFSLRQLAVMALDGRDTSALETFSAETANDQRYVAARQNVSIDYNAARDRMTARIALSLKDGRTLVGDADTGKPAEDLDLQWTRLSEKFTSISQSALGSADRCREVITTVSDFETATPADVKSLVQSIG